jgi:periplasmic protein TonB
MKNIILAGLLTFSLNKGIAQPNTKETEISTTIEVMPEFPGGQEGLYQYLSENVKYPDSAVKYGIEAMVKVRFLILEDGSIDSVKTKQQFGYGLNQEAERVVASMPKWKPGRNGDMPVRVYFQVPIKFTLAKESLKDK